MDDEFDPIDWLRRQDPLAAMVAGSFEAEQALQRLHDRRRAARQRRHRRLAAVVVAVVGSSTAVAVAAIVSGNSPAPTTVTCFADVDLSASRSSVRRGEDPIAACQRAWTDPSLSDVLVGGTPDRLAACTLSSGATAVFPADAGDPCARLGLAGQSPESPDDMAIRSLEARLVEHADGKCVPVDEFVNIADTQLAAHGLSHWDALPSATGNDGDCGTIAIDPEDQTVWIVPFPPQPVSVSPTST